MQSLDSQPTVGGRAQTFGKEMKVLPEYSMNIVVAVKLNGDLRWFVSEKEFWFLDAIAFAAAFSQETPPQEREVSKKLHDGNPDLFMESMSDYEVAESELREWFDLTEVESCEREDAMPCLVVDFDRNRMVNAFPEPGGMFQDFLPDGWQGDYVNDFETVESQIPQSNRYWKNEPNTTLNANA